MSYPALTELRSGDTIELLDANSTGVLWNIWFRRCYAVRADDSVILDVGAHTGIFALWAARRAAHSRIFCVEPFPTNFSTLIRSIERGGLGSRIVAIPRAMAGADGQRRMDTTYGSSNHHLTEDGDLSVECCTLTSLMSEHGLATVDLLKMDVEGAEYEILLSTPPETLRKIRRCEIELHDEHAELREELLRHLASSGLTNSRLELDRNGCGIARFVHAG
jgi:FkbM family methyltransferase